MIDLADSKEDPMSGARRVRLPEHTVEIVSDAGEGAQKAAIAFAQLCAKSGNGLWTVEIIPSEIRPPPHTTGSASGNRIRLAERARVTNAGNRADVVLAFNEMALLSRLEAGSLADDVLVLIDDQWATHDDEQYRRSYREVLDKFRSRGATIIEVPLERETLRHAADAQQGKNMFAVGILCALYSKDLDLLDNVIRGIFKAKNREVIELAVMLAAAGHQYGVTHFEECFEIEAHPTDVPKVAMNGNTALALGAVSAGFEICSMYPITPATSASHELSEIFEDFGGFVHQAEDEIAAIGVALGASYAGKTALTITSGPGMALKTEFQGLAVMTETPLVIVDVQRGGPSTGLPTKIEQADLLACALWRSRGRAQGGHGAEYDRGVLLHSFCRAEDRGGISHARHRPFRREPRDRSAAFRSPRCFPNTATASARPQPGAAGSPTLRLGSNDRPFAAPHPRAAGRHGGDDLAQP